MTNNLSPGDIVIAPAGLMRTTATVAAAVAATYSYWAATHSLLGSGVALVAGGCSGFVLGAILSGVAFPAVRGNVAVVKKQPSAFPLALKASLLGSLPAATLASVVVHAAFATTLSWMSDVAAGFGVGIAVGILFALAGTFL